MGRKKNTEEQPAQKMRQLQVQPSVEVGEVAIYNPDDTIRLEVRLEQETVWLPHTQMGLLFGVDRTVIVKHVSNIYTSNELDEAATCAKIAQVRNINAG